MLRRLFAPVIALAGLASTPAGAGGDGPFDLRAAIARAEPGAEVRVPGGVHAGPVTIDKSITLVGEPGAVIDGGGEGDVLKITAPGVTIRGLTVRNTGTSLDRENAGVTGTAPRITIEGCRFEDVLFGIYLKESPGSIVRANHITSKHLDLPRRGDGIRFWECDGGIVEDNVVYNSRDVVMWFSEGVQLRRNRVTGGRYGLHFMYSDQNVLEENHLEGNSVGAFLMYSHNLALRRNVFARNRGPSGFGLGLKDMDGVDAQDNLLVGNRVGIQLDNSPSRVDIEHHYRHNVIAYNDIGIAFMPSVQRNFFSENSFLDNIEQIAVLGSGAFEGNGFTVDNVGNYWSDYRGYDLDGDGFGDIEYRAEGLFENLMDREPKLRMFLFSPAQHAVEMAARAFPIVAPRPKMTDTSPLMEPARAAISHPMGGGGGSVWAAGAGLLAIGAACIGAGLLPWGLPSGIGAEQGGAG